MRILLYGLNFAPEQTGIGKYTGEMAAWLASSGHSVHVITAPPYYPAWSVAPGYSAWRMTSEQWQGVAVQRSPLWVPSKPTGLKRVFHLLSFALLSIPALARQIPWKPDVVVVIAPAFSCAPGGWLFARLVGAKAWLHVQDFEIDAAFRMGLMKGKLVQRAFGWFERGMLRRFDRVSTISRRMMDVLKSKQVCGQQSVFFPNWVDVSAVRPHGEPGRYRAELGIPEDAVVALFSGSMAGKQGLELLPAAARMLQDRLPNLVFVLCGDGVCKPSLERDCRGLTNVHLLPLQPSHRLGELLRMSDIHLLPQHPEAADLVMPSKLTGMLSSGRPVLTTALPGTELSDVVSGRGIVVPPGDLLAFTTALVTLVEAPGLRRELGLQARRYAEEHLARDRVLADFERELKSCIGFVGSDGAESKGAATSLNDEAEGKAGSGFEPPLLAAPALANQDVLDAHFSPAKGSRPCHVAHR